MKYIILYNSSSYKIEIIIYLNCFFLALSRYNFNKQIKINLYNYSINLFNSNLQFFFYLLSYNIKRNKIFSDFIFILNKLY